MESGIYKNVVDNMTFSYSRLSCFNDCRYQWLLKYIYECDSVDMFYASYGSFIHKILERFYKGELKQEDLLITFLSEFKNNVKGAKPSDKIVDDYIQKGCDYFRNFKPFEFKTVGVEKKINFKIGDRNMIAFVDYIGKKDGKLYIVDNKSRNLKPRSNKSKPTVKDKELDDMLRQLYVYAEAVKQEYGEYPVSLCFNCFKTGVFIEEPFVKSVHEDVIHWVCKQIDKIKNSNDFYPSVDFFRCRYLCGVQNECCYYNT